MVEALPALLAPAAAMLVVNTHLSVTNYLDGRAMVVVRLAAGRSPGSIDSRGTVFEFPEGVYVDPEADDALSYCLAGEAV